jgi:hypothetical protein
MKYINKETKEIFDNPGEVRKSLAPKKLPKVLTKAVLENNNFDYFYEGVEPKVNIFQRAVKSGVTQNEKGNYTYEYSIEEAFESPEEKTKIVESALENAKKLKIEELKNEFDKIVDEFLFDTSLSEKLSWDKQESEARAFLSEPTTPTPYLDLLVISRNKGETKEVLSNSIVTKANLYVEFHGNLLGTYHSKLTEINSKTADADNIIDVLAEISAVSLKDI